MSNITPVEREMLEELYEGHFRDNLRGVKLFEWCAAKGLDEEAARALYRKLSDELGLVESKTIGLVPGITLEGIAYVEAQGWCHKVAQRQDELRKVLLRAGLRHRRAEGRHSWLAWGQTLRESGFGEEEYNRWLEQKYLVERTAGVYRLTDIGVHIAERLEFQESIESRWETMKAVTDVQGVKKRGHELEDLLGVVAEAEGLAVDTQVRSNGEENDLVISADFHHFLVSCKWEKGPAKAEYLDILRARIMKRTVQTNGVLVSVGGFSSELVKEAESNTSIGLVVLVGRGDLERLFQGELRLRDLLLERHTALARYRRTIFEP